MREVYLIERDMQMKISIDLTYVRPSTQRAAQVLLQELIDEVAESVHDLAYNHDPLPLMAHLEWIEVLKPIAK